MDTWIMDHLVCPRDRSGLELRNGDLICPDGHSYPVIDGCPIMLVEEAESTHGYIESTLKKVSDLLERDIDPDVSIQPDSEPGEVDPYVQSEIVYTSGILYYPVQGKLTRYPIPELRLPESDGERLLDIGCNWGRWSVAAGRKGYKPVGIDPSLDAVLAAKRVSRQLGVDANFVVGDARFLPFADNAFDVVYSYSVFQHFSKENAKVSFDQVSRVLKNGHNAFLQMPNRYGVRQFYHHWKRGFTEGEMFEVRYWTLSELMKTFREKFGETKMTAECFFGLGIQKSDVDMLPLKYKAVVYASEMLRKTCILFPPLMNFADSVFLKSVNQKES